MDSILCLKNKKTPAVFFTNLWLMSKTSLQDYLAVEGNNRTVSIVLNFLVRLQSPAAVMSENDLY